MTCTPSRRDFLATTSLAVMSPLLSNGLRLRFHLPTDAARTRLPATAWLPDATPGETLRALATHAVDAAKRAGATYADVRVAELHLLQPSLTIGDPREFVLRLDATFTYGVRVVVDGATAFVYGSTPSADGIAAAARNAVRTARGYAPSATHPTTSRSTPRDVWAAAPVVTGEWTTPHEIDPFTVPLEDHAAALMAFRVASTRAIHTQDPIFSGVHFRWTRECRVFASTDGSLVTQTLFHSTPAMIVAGSLGRGDWTSSVTKLSVPGFSPMSGGFETVTSQAHQDTIKRTAEEAVQLASLPRGMVDVGRYPVVFDGMAFGAILGQTLAPALECDRVMGWERDASGGSFVKLPMLGTQIASPLLSVTANRTFPSVSAVQWDDDGVVPEAYTCLRDGKLVDLHTSRATALLLADWYQSHGLPVRSHGCAVAPRADSPVMVRAPQLTVTPASKPASLSDVCRDLGRGLLIRGAPYVSTDPQFASGSASMGATEYHVSEMFEVVGGVPVRSIHGNAIEFATPKFLQALMALGDATTRYHSAFGINKGNPWRQAQQSITAPAAVVKDVNVIATDIHL